MLTDDVKKNESYIKVHEYFMDKRGFIQATFELINDWYALIKFQHHDLEKFSLTFWNGTYESEISEWEGTVYHPTPAERLLIMKRIAVMIDDFNKSFELFKGEVDIAI